MNLENTRIICETCGDMLEPKDTLNHAFETGHRKFEYKGLVKEDRITVEEDETEKNHEQQHSKEVPTFAKEQPKEFDS